MCLQEITMYNCTSLCVDWKNKTGNLATFCAFNSRSKSGPSRILLDGFTSPSLGHDGNCDYIYHLHHFM